MEKIKITINSDNPNIGSPLNFANEFKKRGIYGEDGDIVMNFDSIYSVGLRKGKRLTIYWEIDDFMMLGSNKEWYLNSDILYINMPEYRMYYPEKTKILRMYCIPEFHFEHKDVKKDFDYVFVGSIEPLPVYKDRVVLLDRMMRTGVNMAIMYGSRENYAKNMSKGKIILNIFPNTEKGNMTVNQRTYEAMATGCLMVNPHPFMERVFKKDVHYLTLDRFGMVTDEEIERIKEAGKKEVLAKHTLSHRVDQLLKDIQEKL